MKQRAVVAVIISIVALFSLVATIDQLPLSGNIPLDVAHLGVCGVRVTAGDQGIAQVGLHPGDAFDLERMPVAQRGPFLLNDVSERSTFSVPIVRDGKPMTVPIAAVPLTPKERRNAMLLLVIAIAWTFFGVLTLWFGRDAASQYAGLFLTVITIGAFTPVTLGESALQNLMFAVVSTLDALAFVALYMLTEELAGPQMRLRTPLRVAVGIGAAVSILVEFAQQWSILDSGCLLAYADSANLAADFLVAACALIGMGMAVFGSDPERRQRARWIFWASVVGLGGLFFAMFSNVVQFPDPTHGYAVFLLLALPVGFVLATLRDRTFDLAFVANRAIVYVVMIVVLVSVFVAVKTAISQYFIGLGGLASTVLDLIVSIAVALSLRAFESRIQKVVERSLFHRKYEALSALQALGAEAANFEHDEVLLASVARAIVSNLQAEWVTVILRSGDSYLVMAHEGLSPVKAVGSDDPALVKLRTKPDLLDLEGLGSEIAASGLVVPMTIGGRLLGAIACGPRSNREVYDPDERIALLVLSTHVAVALFALADHARERFVGEVAIGSLEGHAARVEARRLMKMAFEAETAKAEG